LLKHQIINTSKNKLRKDTHYYTNKKIFNNILPFFMKTTPITRIIASAN